MAVAAFCLAVHNGGDILDGVDIARSITKPHDTSFHELSEPQDLDSQVLIDEVVDLAASVKQALYRMTDEYYVSQAMAEYPQAPYSDLVGNPFLFSVFFSFFPSQCEVDKPILMPSVIGAPIIYLDQNAVMLAVVTL